MVEAAYLPIVFKSQKEEDNLKSIEIFGVPAERLQNDECYISENAKNFLNDCVAEGLFTANRTLSQYSFESLKIWLYNTSKPQDSQGYPCPSRGQIAIELPSHLEASELTSISIVDIGLSGKPYQLWESGCEELFKPMFSRFIAPPDPPDVLKEFLQMRFGTRLSTRLDLYLSMRKNMYFDALIVEAK